MAAKITFVSCTLLLAQLLLLLAPTATTAISIPNAVTSTTEPAAVDDVPALPLPTPEGAAAAADCWKAVLQAESCAIDILRWLASPDLAVRVGAECCGVLVRVGDRCLHDLFPNSAFGALYTPLVKHACGIPISVNPGRRQ